MPTDFDFTSFQPPNRVTPSFPAKIIRNALIFKELSGAG